MRWTSEDIQKKTPEVASVLAKWADDEKKYDETKAKAKYDNDLEKWKLAAEDAKKSGKPEPRKPTLQVRPTTNNNHPANLFNGMINPLVPFAIEGAIWYQGEANAGDEAAKLYATQLPLLIQDWRARWGQGDFPFAWVQLPNFTRKGEGWMVVREAMLKSLKVPNTGMAVTIDVGDPKDIHPKNKQAVGRRLAFWALADVYGEKGVATCPLPAGHKIDGDKVVVTFQSADGLKARSGDVKGFEIAGDDGKFVAAKAMIDGDKVAVSSDAVKEPKAVRYAWADDPDANLVNAAGLPASPFRTSKK